LQLVGVGEIPVGHTEAARSDLLDRRTSGIARRQRLEALRVLASLAGVAASTDAIQGNGERLVRLCGNGAEAHGAGAETPYDRGRGLHSLERNGRSCDPRPKLEQAPQGAREARLIVELGRKLPI